VLRLAQRAFEAKDYARAGELVTTLLDAAPADKLRENAIYLRGQVLIAQGNWDQARIAFEALLKEFPKSELAPMAEFGVAEAVFRQGDAVTAEERFRKLTEQAQWHDASWPALVRLRVAQTLCHQKKWKEALAIAEKIEKAYPGFEEQYEVDYAIGRCLADQADFERAREAYRKVIRSASGAKTETAAKAQLMIAESFYHQKNYEAALREYLRVEILYAFPAEQAAALMQAGRCHEHLGEWKEAAAAYSRLIKTYPNTKFAKEAGQRRRDAEQRAAGHRG
jgi:TolA-binding protein